MFFAAKKDPRETQSYLDALHGEDLHLNLNGIHLVYGDNCRWAVESSDLDTAAKEIDVLIEERDELALALKEAHAHVEELNKEVMETNDVKNVTMAMLVEERQKNAQLLRDLAAYREELKESYRIIMELREALPAAPTLVTDAAGALPGATAVLSSSKATAPLATES